MTKRTMRSASPLLWGHAFVLVGALIVGGCAIGQSSQAGAVSTEPEARSTLGGYLAGRFAQNEQDYLSAADYFLLALSGDPQNPQLLEEAVKALVGAGRIEEARAVALRLIEVEPKAAGAHIVLALGELKQGQYAAAEERLAELVPQGLNGFVIPLVRAWVAAGQGQPDRALDVLSPVGHQQGFEAVYQLNVGLINEAAGRSGPAGDAFTKALAGADDPPFRLVQIAGGFYERSGQVDKAKDLYREFAAGNQGSSLLEPILERISAGDPSEPVVANPAEGVAESLFNLASALNQERLYEAALLYTRLALDMRPDFPVAQILLGDVMVGQGHYAEATEAYRGVSAGSPFYWAAHLRIANTLGEQGKVDEAAAEFKRLAAERPGRADALIELGNLMRSHERFEEAVDAYDQALARIGTLDQRHWTLLYYRGVALQRSDQWSRAQADFLKALELEPDQPHVLNYLAYTWVERGENYDQALEMLNKAVTLRPEDGYIVDSLGWVYYRLGRYEEAVQELEKAIELRPNDPVINDHLGDAYWRVGRRHEARYQWHRALSFKPEADQVAPIQAKLQNGLDKVPSDS
ncbi:MAG TPA: tetratricopeptide repeat protein [Alphaproteobacteria bacterium]|nr:tetratricopeptide repeat protein [Alphaproteobacteria bacterium]